MKFVENVTAIHGQTVPKLGLQPGSWVTVGQSGKVTGKGCYMGSISGIAVIAIDDGQPRPEFHALMKSQRQLVVNANKILNS